MGKLIISADLEIEGVQFGDFVSQRDLIVAFSDTAVLVAEGTDEVGTSWEALGDIAGFTTLGWALLCNLDETNYVQVSHTSKSILIRLPPLGPALIRLNTAEAPLAKANTAPCTVQYLIFSP